VGLANDTNESIGDPSCQIEDRPELGRGLEIARRFGVADLDEDGVRIVASSVGRVPTERTG